MTANQSTILSCLKTNLKNARTPGRREFVQKQITDFQAHIEKTNRPAPKFSNPMSRFADAL